MVIDAVEGVLIGNQTDTFSTPKLRKTVGNLPSRCVGAARKALSGTFERNLA